MGRMVKEVSGYNKERPCCTLSADPTPTVGCSLAAPAHAAFLLLMCTFLTPTGSRCLGKALLAQSGAGYRPPEQSKNEPPQAFDGQVTRSV